MSRSKRRPRTSRGRGPKRGFKREAYLALFFALLALVVLIAQVCKRPPKSKSAAVARRPGGSVNSTPKLSPPAGLAEAGMIASRYSGLIGRAGGDGAWIKRPAQTGAAAAPGEVLALAPASQAIVSALEQQASNDGLRCEAQPAASGSRVEAIRVIALSQGNQPLCVWRLREVPRLYRAAIVIDDLGQDLRPARGLLRLPYALTFSILPELRASRETALAAHQSGREVMLHLPMEPVAAARMNPGAGAIRVGMGAVEVDRVIEADLASVPYVAGVNNHMGSRATSDAALMAEVMKEIASRRLYFIDSRTASSTLALDAARRDGIPAFYRSVFLDDTQTVEYTLGQLRRFRAAVEAQGVALAIGHPHATTIAALQSYLPELTRADIELIPASRLVRSPEAARLSPGRAQPKANGD